MEEGVEEFCPGFYARTFDKTEAVEQWLDTITCDGNRKLEIRGFTTIDTVTGLQHTLIVEVF